MNKITLDVGGLGIKGIKFDSNNKEINNWKLEYTKRLDSFRVDMNHVLETIKEFLDKEKEEYELGLSFPGIIDKDNYKVVTESAITVADINLKDYFVNNLCKKVILENDAKAAIAGEYIYGQKREPKILVHITIGTGVGGGIIIDDKLLRGFSNKAGEFSKLYVDCSSKSDSIIAITSGVGASIVKYSRANNLKNFLTGIELMKKYKEEDKIAVEIVNEWITSLAKFIINIDFIVDFEKLTIGGGISENELFMKLLKDKIKEKAILDNQDIVNKIEKAKLKNQAGCYGCLAILNNEKF